MTRQAPPIVCRMKVATWAGDLARQLLEEPLPRRWAHTQGVASRATSLRPILGLDAELIVAAAWLHDIGYAPDLIDTGFHPLDGARYLRDVEGAGERLCQLVAHHTCARIEAGERGLADKLTAEFPAPDECLVEALTYCDVTTSPDGEPLDVDARLAEIRARYGPDHLVTRSIRAATPCLTASVRNVEKALADAGTAG